MSRILFVIMMLIVAAYNASVVRAEQTTIENVLPKPYKFQPKGFQTCDSNPLAADGCRVIEKMEQFTILHQPGDETCPAGYYYLLDDKQQTASDLTTEECDPSVVLNFVKNPVSNEVLIVMSLHGEPVTRFTIQ
jgi:hypothetical protein